MDDSQTPAKAGVSLHLSLPDGCGKGAVPWLLSDAPGDCRLAKYVSR